MSPMLSRIYESEGGVEILDVLMKYLYVTQVAKPRLTNQRPSTSGYPLPPPSLNPNYDRLTKPL